MHCMGTASPWACRSPLLVFEIGLSSFPLKPVRRLAHGTLLDFGVFGCAGSLSGLIAMSDTWMLGIALCLMIP
jgi:hypothetical protein